MARSMGGGALTTYKLYTVTVTYLIVSGVDLDILCICNNFVL